MRREIGIYSKEEQGGSERMARYFKRATPKGDEDFVIIRGVTYSLRTGEKDETTNNK